MQQSCSDLLAIANTEEKVSELAGNNCEYSLPVGVLR